MNSATQPVTGNTTHTQPENRAFFPALDGLRAIAFLMVFFQHYISLPWGWTGVNVFFVLSGFLITGILYDVRNEPYRARNFYLRRTLRIFPLYYGIFLALLLLNPIMHWAWSREWLAWPLYVGNFLRFTSPAVMILGTPQQIASDAHLMNLRIPNLEANLGHLWSLCVEEQFYLIWPWVVFWVRSRKALLWICGLAVVIVPLLRFAATFVAPPWMLDKELLYRATPFQIDSLLLGGLLALLWRGSHRQMLIAAGRYLSMLGLLVAAAYIACTLQWDGAASLHHYQYPAWRLTWGLSFVNILAAALIAACLQPGNWIARTMALPWLRSLGRVSYGAYIFHDLFRNLYIHAIYQFSSRTHLMILVRHMETSEVVFGLPCTIIIAQLSFRYFESRFLDLKDRWTRNA